MFKDAMEYAAESKNAEVAEDLLAYFLEHRYIYILSFQREESHILM